MPWIHAAPPVVSLVIATRAPIYSQLGTILPGNEPGRSDRDMPYIRGCLVHVLYAPAGIVYPPQTDGQPDPRTMLLQVTYIGLGIDLQEDFPGRFATMLTPRPAHGSKIFARVFNQPSTETASFYSDSSLFEVSQLEDIPFIADITNTSNPIDPADQDGDGLNNSWERWNGSNPDLIDTDGDGFNDREELLVGTDSDDQNSLLHIIDMSIIDNRISLLYMAGKDNPPLHYQSSNLTVFTKNEIASTAVKTASGGYSVEVPVPTNSNLQIFRFGVNINEL